VIPVARLGLPAFGLLFLATQLAAQSSDRDESTRSSVPASTPVPEPGEVGVEVGDGWGEVDAAAGGEEPDDIGFDAPSAPSEATTAPGILEGWGTLRHRLALWSERLDDEPFARARQSADFALRYKKPLRPGAQELTLRLFGEIHLEYDFVYLHEPDRFDEVTLETYRSQVIGREGYAALSWGALELTVGRQIVPWGQGELLTTIDVVNPRDQREPGLADIEDIRMAVMASRLGLFIESHRIEAMVVHETFFGLRPPPLSFYSPIRALLLEDPALLQALAGKTVRYTHGFDRFDDPLGQIYGRWSYVGAGVDLALYAAYTREQQGVPVLPGMGALATAEVALELPLEHTHFTMLGHSGAKPLGPFVVRWEIAVDLGRPFSAIGPDEGLLAIESERRNQLSWFAAVSYAGSSDSSIAIEYSQSHVFDMPAGEPGSTLKLLGPVTQPGFGLQIMHSFPRERFRAAISAVVIGVDPYNGGFARAEFDYELAEALHAGLGYVVYVPSRTEFGPLYGLTTHDQAFAALRWDFVFE
jgi:hypothetical protein